jgi:glycosyltransferase involved in cell wall biosynthesis
MSAAGPIEPATRSRSFLFLSYDPDVPSFRYRMTPVIEELRRQGHHCELLQLPSGRYFRRLFAVRERMRRSDVVVVAKIKLTPPEPRLLRRWSRRLAFDFDDAIYIRRPRAPGLPPHDSSWRRTKFAATCAAMDLVIAGNETLAAVAMPHSKRVEIVPTPIDTQRYGPPVVDGSRPPTLVWIGLPDNLGYLEMVRPAMAQLMRRWSELRLRVISSEFPDWHDVRVERFPWSSAAEIDGLATADIGLMPLTDDEWTRGKCAFKLLQYSAASLPSVASDVGANREAVVHGQSGFLVKTSDDWGTALATLIESPDLRAEFGRCARAHVEAHFAADVVARRAAQLLTELAA